MRLNLPSIGLLNLLNLICLYFREFVPLIQQAKFENIINRIQTFEPKPELQPGGTPSAHKVGERRYTSLCVRKQTIWVSTRSDTNQAAQSPKMVRSLNFCI